MNPGAPPKRGFSSCGPWTALTLIGRSYSPASKARMTAFRSALAGSVSTYAVPCSPKSQSTKCTSWAWDGTRGADTLSLHATAHRFKATDAWTVPLSVRPYLRRGRLPSANDECLLNSLLNVGHKLLLA